MTGKKASYYTVGVSVKVSLSISPDTSLLVPERYRAVFCTQEKDSQAISSTEAVQTLLNQKTVVSDELCKAYPPYQFEDIELIIDGEIVLSKITNKDPGFRSFLELEKTPSFVFLFPLESKATILRE